MPKKKQKPEMFALINFAELPNLEAEELFGLWKAYYPAGSGPLQACRVICGCLEHIASVRGLDIRLWPIAARLGMSLDDARISEEYLQVLGVDPSKDSSKVSVKKYKCTECGHVQDVKTVIGPDGGLIVGSGADFCDACDGVVNPVVC